MKKIIIISTIILIGLFSTWYFDVWHRPVETINELIGQNYDFAQKNYFQTDPDRECAVNVNDELNEFDGGILDKKKILNDSIIHVFTWNFTTHKKTIWVGKTKTMNHEIIDAIRYKNGIEF